MALRFDTCRFDAVEHLPNNAGVRVRANLTRSGIFVYKNPDGSERREYRPPEEVFKQDSMQTFAGVPVTIGHPGLVTSEIWQKVAVGNVGDTIKQDGDLMSGVMTIRRADAVEAVTRGDVKEVSMGYEVDIDPTPGECKEGRYDCIQRNMRGNHAALIPPGTGRAGSSVALRLDSKGDEVWVYTPPVTITPEQLAAEKTRADAAEKTVETLKAEKAVLEGKVAELSDTSRFDSAVEERVSIVDKAREILGGKYIARGKTNRQVKADVVLKLNPAMRLDAKASDDFVEAAYQMALKFAPQPSEPHESHRRVRQDVSEAPAVEPIATAYEKNRQASVGAWKTSNRASLLGK